MVTANTENILFFFMAAYHSIYECTKIYLTSPLLTDIQVASRLLLLQGYNK